MEKIALLNLDPRDQRLIKKFTLAGVGAGAGTALLTQLASYLRSLRAESANDTSKDDDTLTVTLPSPVKAAGVGAGVGVAAGGLASVAAYVLARKAMLAAQKRDLQKQVDEAQQVYLGQLAAPAKMASTGKPLGAGEMLLSSPVALSLLLAAASGTLAYNSLDSKFSAKPKPVSPAPKRIQFRYATPKDPAMPEGEQIEKEASIPESCGFEILGRMALAARPAHGDFADVVGAICAGRLDELRHNFGTIGADAALNMVKGAAEHYAEAPEPLRGLAVAAAVADPIIGETGRWLAHAELVEATPAIATKIASVAARMEDSDREELIALTAVLGACARVDSQAPIAEGVEMSKAASTTWLELLRAEFA